MEPEAQGGQRPAHEHSGDKGQRRDGRHQDAKRARRQREAWRRAECAALEVRREEGRPADDDRLRWTAQCVTGVWQNPGTCTDRYSRGREGARVGRAPSRYLRTSPAIWPTTFTALRSSSSVTPRLFVQLRISCSCSREIRCRSLPVFFGSSDMASPSGTNLRRGAEIRYRPAGSAGERRTLTMFWFSSAPQARPPADPR